MTGFDRYNAPLKIGMPNKEMYAGRRARIALGNWNELGAAGTHHFLFVAPLHVHPSTSLLDLSFCTYRDGWLHNLEDVRRRCRREERPDAARRGLSRASVPAARSRAVNFELVRDATAYVCPECGTKCARSYRSKRERETPMSRGTRAPERSFLSCACRAAASFSSASTSERLVDSTRRFCRREMYAKTNLHGTLSTVYRESIVRVKKKETLSQIYLLRLKLSFNHRLIISFIIS